MKKILFFLLTSCFCQAYEYQVAICTVFRDEAPYLKEWIEFHKLVGVEHFYLYNNNSTDHYEQVLAPYIEEGIVELNDWSLDAKNRFNWKRIQTEANLDGIVRALGKVKWMALIDADEFIFPVRDKTLPKLLKNYEAYGAVALHWRLFGTSHIEHLDPNYLMIEQLIYRCKDSFYANRLVKSIVQVDRVNIKEMHKESCVSSHVFPLLPPFSTVNLNKKRVNGEMPKLQSETYDIGVIHHYAFRDENFFHNTKLNRPNITNGKKETLINRSIESNKIKDDRLFSTYGEQLRKTVDEK